MTILSLKVSYLIILEIPKKINNTEVGNYFRTIGEELNHAVLKDSKEEVSNVVKKAVHKDSGITWETRKLKEEKGGEGILTENFDDEEEDDESVKKTVTFVMKIHGNSWVEVKKTKNFEDEKFPYGLFSARTFQKGTLNHFIRIFSSSLHCLISYMLLFLKMMSLVFI